MNEEKIALGSDSSTIHETVCVLDDDLRRNFIKEKRLWTPGTHTGHRAKD